MSLSKPDRPLNVLVLGGTTTVARALTTYLVQDDRAAFVRIADRFSVKPPTTYVEKSFLELLNAPQSKVEYTQVNLASVDKHRQVFTPPLGSGKFDVVYDLTGDTAFDKPELIHVSNTYQLALSLAQSAAAFPESLKPGAYVRLTFPFYEMKSLSSSSAGYAEDAELKPDGVRGRWWHEVLRGLGKVAGLNTGVIRCGAWYGPGTWDGQVLPRLVVGHVYKYLQKKMEFLYNADMRIHTIHSIDIAQALYLLSIYLLSTPRSAVMAQAVDIPYTFSSSSSAFSMKRSSVSEAYKTVETVVSEKEVVRLPLFNVVDEWDATQEKLAKVVAEVWGIKFGFLNSTIASLVQQFAKTDFTEMVEDVNEMHVEAWGKMLEESTPPIASTPISPFLDEHAFKKLAVCLDGSKAKRVLGFKATRPQVQVSELRAIVKAFQDDRLWPTL